MAECKLSDGGGADCTFRAQLGAVRLSVEGTTGTVLFERATYNGEDIPNLPASTISFNVIAEKADLAVVYSFSHTVSGAGVLKEECDGHTALIGVSVRNRNPVYHICG